MSNIEKLLNIGKIIASNENIELILETILDTAIEITNADAGTIYLKSEDEKYLRFIIVKNKTLNIQMGGRHSKINWPNLPLYINGKENLQMVAVVSALKNKVINIPDVYESREYNFEGTKKFDKNTGYRSKSMLVIPMKNHENEVIGVLQLINKIKNNKIIPFTKKDEETTLSLASQAAIVITKNILIKDLEKLLNSFLQSIAMAIDEKSPYTGGHTRRVEKITAIVVEEINKTHFKNKSYTKNEIEAIKMAAWLHDIGKITTPEYIIDKATKLQTVFDRIEFVLAKLEIVKRDFEISYLKNEIDKKTYQEKIEELNNYSTILKTVNTGNEFTDEKMIEKLNKIKGYSLIIDKKQYQLLSENEFYNLSVKKGTLTKKEREIIQNHVRMTIKMLEEIYFPKKYKRVPEIAGAHHEKLDGSGYPRGLKDGEISFEARILAIADIFEALTASDRPYKKAMKLSKAMNILYNMAKDGEIDKDIFKFFYEKKLYLKYAKEELKPENIDEVKLDIDKL